MSVGGGLGALQCFGNLKRALELLIYVIMSPLATFYHFVEHLVDISPLGIKNKTKK